MLQKLPVALLLILWVAGCGSGTTASSTSALNSNSMFAEFDLPDADGSTHEITVGPDGNLWITQMMTSKVIRLTTSGIITVFPQEEETHPHGIVFDKLGQLWITLQDVNALSQIDTLTGREIQRISLLKPGATTIAPHGLGLGPDGTTLWFTGKYGNQIGKVVPTTGAVTLYPLPHADSEPLYIKRGYDDNMWFTEYLGNRVGFITPAGIIHEFDTPTPESGPIAIVPDSKNNFMWFSEALGHAFATVDASGTIVEHPVPTATAVLAGLGLDSTGSVWLSYQSPNYIGHVASDFSVKEYAVPTASAVMHRIILGPDGNMWFTEISADKVGHVVNTAQLH